MKQIIFTLLLGCMFVIGHAQVKVYTNGKMVSGDNTGVTDPIGQVHIVRALNEQKQAIYADAPASSTNFTTTWSSLYLSNTNGTNNNYARLNFGDGDDAAAAALASRIENHGTNGGSLEMWTRSTSGGAIQRRMAIQNNGNVMIGSGTADALLSVNGDASKIGGGTWASFSDKRLKKDVSKFEDGLDAILQIEPVKFRYNGKAGIKDTESEFVGIIAQKMQEVAPYTIKEVAVDVMDDHIVRTDKDESVEANMRSKRTENYLQFDPNALTYMLINAIKEQQEIIEDKEDRISDLELKFQELENALEDLKASGGASSIKNQSEVTLRGFDLAGLEQNVPNPFNGFTTIEYVVPSKATSAQIDIYNIKGHLLKTVVIDHIGEGQLTVNVEDLPAGTYSYQLVVDGTRVSTKKMILSN